MAKIGVVLSGGGHRAALFGLGVLLYLADSKKNREVASITSVSGGSLTNAWVGQEVDYALVSGAEFEDTAGSLARKVARQGTLWAFPGTWIYIVALAVAAVASVGVWLLDSPLHIRIVAFAALLLLVALLLSLRSFVCGRAFAATLFKSRGRPTRLSELAAGIDHVICATELHSGEHLYFAPRFVYGWRLGWGEPSGLPVHVAVQASVAFPGAFSPRWIRAARFNFRHGKRRPRVLALLDGGVYDNMADQWPAGLRERMDHWGETAPPLEPLDELVVVNASAAMEWSEVLSLGLPFFGELASLKRTVSILYDNTTAHRRLALVGRFDHAALRERDGGESPDDLTGALVYITQSPYLVPDTFTAQPSWPDRAERARAALARLEALGMSRENWFDTARASARLPTTLRRLGGARSARLLHHAYVLAAVNLHVVLGYPLIDLPGLSRFENLVEGAT